MPIAAIRKHGGVTKREVNDWGLIVKSRLARSAATVGAKKSGVLGGLLSH